MMYNWEIKWLTIVILATTVLWATNGDANELRVNNNYDPNSYVTMDVVKSNQMGGGTYRCTDFRACYTWVLRAEERGVNQYCQSIKIKRNGNVIWSRSYN